MHKSLSPFFLFAFFMLANVISAQNILENGGFEDGQGDWNSYYGSGYSGSLNIVSSNVHSGEKAAKINVDQVASSPSALNAQLKNNSFHIDAGHSYQLSLWMKADHTIDVQIILVQNTSPWTWLGAKTVTLSTSYQMFDLYIDSAPFTTDDDVRFAVRCGNEEADIYVDDVVLTDCSKPSGYQSLHTSVTGKGTVNIANSFATTECIRYCNSQFATGDSLTLTAEAEQGYTFSGWTGACTGAGSCTVSMDTFKFIGAHFSKTGTDNSCLDYRNRTDWNNAGYEGVIPYDGNIIDMTQSPYFCIGNGTHNNYTALQTALSNANNDPGFDIIYFPAGNYLIEGEESFLIKSNTVIRGECPTNTTLTINAISITGGNYEKNHVFRIYTYNDTANTKYKLMGGHHKGSSCLVVENPQGIAINDFIEIRERNDSAKIWTNRIGNGLDQADWDYNYYGSATNVVGEIAQIIGINGNALILDRELHFSYDPKQRPFIYIINVTQNSGIENIKLHRSDQKDNYNIQIYGAYNCWVRNIESSYTQKAHISLGRSYHIEIRDSYFHHSYDYGGKGHGYGTAINHRATNCLIENNAFNTLRHSMVLSYCPNGNVFGYNYSVNSRDQNYLTKQDISLHGFYPLMNLFEGNIVEYIVSSDWWGPSGPGNTFFRNRGTAKPIKVFDNSHYQNIIGNEITNFNLLSNIEIESGVIHTLLHSNNDQGNILNDQINTLPNSLYRSDPNFNYGQPIPNIGPVSTLDNDPYPIDQHDNNAKDRYDSGNYVECLSPCNISIDSLSFVCDSSMYIQLDPNANTTILYGITITSITSNYNDFEPTEGDPELYFVLKENGTIIYTSSAAPSSMPDVYIPCSPQTISNNNYAVLIYDDDVSNDDLLGTVSFTGNSSGSFFYTNYSGEVLGIYLNKTKYDRLYSWSTGSTNNYETFTQNGPYSVTVTDIQGCEREKKFHVCWPCTYTESWPNNLSLSNTLSGQEDHHARIKLEAENIIQSGANVQYKSAGEVLLKPGFHSQSNSQFRAYIIDCGD